MAQTVAAVSAVSEIENTGISAFARNALQELKEQEAKIHEGFAEGLRPDGDLMKLPDHVTEQFKRWENKFQSPEDLALVDAVKQRVIALHENGAAYVRERVENNIEKMRLELAMKAVSKTTQGIQQLLSAQ